MSRFGRLPPVKAMRALEALDRLRSAGAVAEEMSLTRSAVSHMLRRLEDDLGFAISEPDGRGIRLTVRGKRYAQEARRALDIMSRAAADEPALSGELKVVAPPGFATFWLADRIGSFADQYPDISIHLAAARVLGDIADETAVAAACPTARVFVRPRSAVRSLRRSSAATPATSAIPTLAAAP